MQIKKSRDLRIGVDISFVPEMIEFWFGRTGPMHQRYRYQRNGTSWAKSFVNP